MAACSSRSPPWRGRRRGCSSASCRSRRRRRSRAARCSRRSGCSLYVALSERGGVVRAFRAIGRGGHRDRDLARALVGLVPRCAEPRVGRERVVLPGAGADPRCGDGARSSAIPSAAAPGWPWRSRSRASPSWSAGRVARASSARDCPWSCPSRSRPRWSSPGTVATSRWRRRRACRSCSCSRSPRRSSHRARPARST